MNSELKYKDHFQRNICIAFGGLLSFVILLYGIPEYMLHTSEVIEVSVIKYTVVDGTEKCVVDIGDNERAIPFGKNYPCFYDIGEKIKVKSLGLRSIIVEENSP